MNARSRPKLYNMSSFHRDYGLDRTWVAGFVCGAKINTFRGDRNSLCVDEQGRTVVLKAAADLGMIADVITRSTPAA